MELNNSYIGSYIKFMRQKAELTQQELAERIGVGKTTVSKWEQGRGIPDITLLYSLSRVLDVDIEDLLAGNLDDIGKEWTGIICTGTTMDPYLEEREWEWMVSMFLLVGIRNIVVFNSNEDTGKLKDLLGGYCDRGYLKSADCTNSMEELLYYLGRKSHACLLYQPAFLYGMHVTKYMRRAMLGREIKILALRQGRTSIFPEISFDNDCFCTGLGKSEGSEWHMFPMFFGESMKINAYLKQQQKDRHMDILLKELSPISVEAMGRGIMAFSFQTKEKRDLAKQVLMGIEETQNIKIGNLDEIMKVRRWE